MSPIGECPSHDETEENDRKGLGMNDSIVTEALLRMTGKGLLINYVTQRGEGGALPDGRVDSVFTLRYQFKLRLGLNPFESTLIHSKYSGYLSKYSWLETKNFKSYRSRK